MKKQYTGKHEDEIATRKAYFLERQDALEQEWLAEQQKTAQHLVTNPENSYAIPYLVEDYNIDITVVEKDLDIDLLS